MTSSGPIIEYLAREHARDSLRRAQQAARVAALGHSRPRAALTRRLGRLLVSAGASLGGLPSTEPLFQAKAESRNRSQPGLAGAGVAPVVPLRAVGRGRGGEHPPEAC